MASFSDKFKQNIRRTTEPLQKLHEKIGAKPGFAERAKKGRLRGFGDVTTALGLTQSAEQISARADLFTAGNVLKAGERSIRTDIDAAAYGGNLGHFVARPLQRGFKNLEGETPPPITADPRTGADVNEATSRARRNAAAAAAARRRASQTVTTTPLGVTERAATSKKRLLGE